MSNSKPREVLPVTGRCSISLGGTMKVHFLIVGQRQVGFTQYLLRPLNAAQGEGECWKRADKVDVTEYPVLRET